MKGRRSLWLLWLICALCLYFFENGTGTRIVLLCTVLFPFLPGFDRLLTEPDAAEEPKQIPARPVAALSLREDDEPDGTRDYVPGDPVSRIHWKLSAGHGALLVRVPAREAAVEDAERDRAEGVPTSPSGRKRHVLPACILALLALILLMAVPAARTGALALANRLFEKSEAVNAYVYERFPVPDGQSVVPAALLLSAFLIGLTGAVILSGSRHMALGLMAGCVLFQVWFGLSLPAWVNAGLCVLFLLWLVRRPLKRRELFLILAGAAVVSLTAALLLPGTDSAMEAASERVRDRLSMAGQQIAGTAGEAPAGVNETRHVHTRTLAAGEEEAGAGRDFRLVTVEENRISMPRWINYLKAVLLLLLTAALPVLPFVPFALLNARRKKARMARQVFRSENVSEAVCAIFQENAAWLEAAGLGAGNAPYAAWPELLSKSGFSDAYREQFRQCEALFEEAAYSDHPLGEEQRRQALALLDETAGLLREQCGWKQRLRLRYKECVWI